MRQVSRWKMALLMSGVLLVGLALTGTLETIIATATSTSDMSAIDAIKTLAGTILIAIGTAGLSSLFRRR